MADTLLAEVGAVLRKAADEAVLPLFRRLDQADVAEKAPGEVVTIADQRAEEIITAGLLRLCPGSVVVGEEAVSADPDLLDHLRGSGEVWLVDPVDGTANFAAGRRPFALMAALLRDGEPVASWVLDPLAETLATARSGEGTYLNGQRVRVAGSALPVTALRGAAPARFLPQPMRATVQAGAARVGELLPGQHCAGREYLDLLTGEQQFVLFWRTLPWDHVPGALLVREAGGVARRFDGTDYRPTGEGSGLLAATDERIWDEVRAALLPD